MGGFEPCIQIPESFKALVSADPLPFEFLPLLDVFLVREKVSNSQFR